MEEGKEPTPQPAPPTDAGWPVALPTAPSGYGWPGPWAPVRPGARWPDHWVPVRPPPFIPGAALYAMTALVLVAGIYGSSQPDLSTLLMIAVFAGLTIGLVWLISFWVAALDTRLQYSRRTWARWAGIPIMCFVCLTVIASGLPMTARFQLSKSALEQAATRVEAGDQYGPGWIGFYSVQGARRVNGTATFVLSGSWDQGCGLARTSGSSSDRETESGTYLVASFGDGWWYWCSGGYGD